MIQAGAGSPRASPRPRASDQPPAPAAGFHTRRMLQSDPLRPPLGWSIADSSPAAEDSRLHHVPGISGIRIRAVCREATVQFLALRFGQLDCVRDAGDTVPNFLD